MIITSEQIQKAVDIGKELYPRIDHRVLQYGTAGFREKSCDLNHVLYRMGLLAAIRSSNRCATVGVMITASHNPIDDNGVKLIDPTGEMLASEWEVIATNLANAPDDDLGSCLNDIIQKHLNKSSQKPFVFLGQDTRPSSENLNNAAKKGAEIFGSMIKDFGVVTTPELHFVVSARNAGGELGIPTEGNYINRMTWPFTELWGPIQNTKTGNYEPIISLDGANGVGALKIKLLKESLDKLINIKVYNDGDGELNHECGADFVKVQQKAPKGLEGCNTRGASLDGDADRIVYFYNDQNRVFHLLDGDKIATLIAGYLQELLIESGLKLKLGIVQTAYANGSSTAYIAEKLKVPVACEPTGVKYLHHKASEFDIGVYFEANGHGTVLFNYKVTEAVRDESIPEPQKSAARKIYLLTQMINQCTGDALADLLLVETILHAKGWSAEDWDNSYTDLPNRQLKVKVKDRRVVTTTDAERKCVTPIGLQEKIDEVASKKPKGRAFVRPSGTEDVVRVYAESTTQHEADDLANQVAQITYNLAGGTGNLSLIPL